MARVIRNALLHVKGVPRVELDATADMHHEIVIRAGEPQAVVPIGFQRHLVVGDFGAARRCRRRRLAHRMQTFL